MPMPSRTPGTPAENGASVTDGPIYAAEVLARADFWTNKGILYDQDGHAADPQGVDYRTDCSGYVSMALHLDAPGLDTAPHGLADVTVTITRDELQPGDIMMAPSKFDASGDKVQDGHVLLFHSWTDSSHTTYNAYEFGSTPVRYRVVTYPNQEDPLQRAFTPYHYPQLLPGGPAVDHDGAGRGDGSARNGTGFVIGQ
jgi:hypothetical protein